MKTRKGFKLMRVRKDGSLGPLFINCRQRIPIGQWLTAEAHRRKGYAFRPGWHVMDQPVAPHLKLTPGRAWFQVEFADFTEERRPESQGGLWFLAQRMRVLAAYDPQGRK